MFLQLLKGPEAMKFEKDIHSFLYNNIVRPRKP